MKWLILCLSIGWCCVATTVLASTEGGRRPLRVYTPGGPHQVLQECAEIFEARHGVDVEVIKALPHDLATRLPHDGDIYCGGAEYMVEDLDRGNPGLLDMDTFERLHPRRIGIIVRSGNPLNIRSTEDLPRAGVDLLDVKLEEMRPFHGASAGASPNIRKFVYTGQQGHATWLTHPELDAWVTYRSWHVKLGGEAEFVEIPGDHALRYTSTVLTHRSPSRETARKFVDFLKSDEARSIFEKYGWH